VICVVQDVTNSHYTGPLWQHSL